jgi:hypothetical protein
VNLNGLFPANDVLRSDAPDLPTAWGYLISVPRHDALLMITGCLGLTESSDMGKAIIGALDFGFIAPRRHRERRDIRLWSLAIMYEPSRALLFGCPTADCLMHGRHLPSDYLEIVTRLGNLRFDVHSGVLIWPALVESMANHIALAMSDGIPAKDLLPFYDHKTGDYDCWLSNDFARSYTFNHERCDLQEFCDGGLVGWMQKRFYENLG